MTLEQFYQRKVDKYLRGGMSTEEEAQFLEECNTNEKLKKIAIATAYLVKALQKIINN